MGPEETVQWRYHQSHCSLMQACVSSSNSILSVAVPQALLLVLGYITGSLVAKDLVLIEQTVSLREKSRVNSSYILVSKKSTEVVPNLDLGLRQGVLKEAHYVLIPHVTVFCCQNSQLCIAWVEALAVRSTRHAGIWVKGRKRKWISYSKKLVFEPKFQNS